MKFIGEEGLTALIAQIKKGLNSKANTATNLSGYGITDAKIANGVVTLGSNTITPLTSSNISTSANATGYYANSAATTVDGNKVVDVKTLKTITDSIDSSNATKYATATSLESKANAADVYSKTEADALCAALTDLEIEAAINEAETK